MGKLGLGNVCQSQIQSAIKGIAGIVLQYTQNILGIDVAGAGCIIGGNDFYIS